MKNFYVICDNIRSLENIGSIFRTADALGVLKIFLCGISGRPPHHKISKTALGAEKTIPFEYYRQTGRLIDKLKKSKINIIALEQAKNAIDCRKFKPKFPLALMVGNEVEGISKRADAEKLVGRAVEWKSPAGRIIKGKISGAHGNNGVVRAIFEKGLPGQAITTHVEISGGKE